MPKNPHVNRVDLIQRGFVKPTPEADALRTELERRGVRVLTEVFDGHKHIDLSIPSAKLNVEVDGIHHLTDPDQLLADLSRGYYSDKLGYHTLHIPNELIRTHLDQIADSLSLASKILEERISVHLTK